MQNAMNVRTGILQAGTPLSACSSISRFLIYTNMFVPCIIHVMWPADRHVVVFVCVWSYVELASDV